MTQKMPCPASCPPVTLPFPTLSAPITGPGGGVHHIALSQLALQHDGKALASNLLST